MKQLCIATLLFLAAVACHKSEPANTDTTYAAPTNDTAAMNTSPPPTGTTATNATSGTTVTTDPTSTQTSGTTATTSSAKSGTY